MHNTHKSFLLSIVIPTKNRFEYIISCISSLRDLVQYGIELIVVDNSDSNELQLWIEEQGITSFCNYIKVSESISVSQNFQIGIDAAQGEYVCTIGDDDTVNKEIIQLVKWAKEKQIDAITPRFIADYIWPDLKSSNSSLTGGELRIRKFSGLQKYPSVKKGLIRLTKTCGTDLADSFYLPKIYYGVIRLRILQEAKKSAGSNFPGVSPDLSGAVTSAAYVIKYCVIDYPIFLPGSSKKSTAGLSLQKKHFGSLEEQPHISRSAVDNWPALIPKYFSVETVWSQSAFASLAALNRKDLLLKFNFSRIYAYSLMFNPVLFKQARIAIRLYHRGNLFLMFFIYFKILLEYLNYVLIRFRYLIKNIYNRIFDDVTVYKGIKNIKDASIVLNEYLEDNSISIEKYLK